MIKKWLEKNKQEQLKYQERERQREKDCDRDREELYDLAAKLGIDCWNETTMYLSLFRLLDEQEQKIRKLEEDK